MQIGEDLIKDCIERKRSAQNLLYKEVFSYLMNICIRYKNDYSEAGASLNAIYLKILNNIENYQKESSFIAWIKRIAINHLIDEYRKEKKDKERISFTEKDSSLENNYNSFHSKEAEMEAEYLILMINRLPTMTSRVFNLYAIDGYKHREIAELLGMSENTSKWHLREARIQLKAMLEIFNETVTT